MSKAPKTALFVLSRLNKKGGQERSTLEVVSHLHEKGWKIRILSYVLEDADPNFFDESLLIENKKFPVIWHKIPFFFLPTHFIRDLWLGIYSFFYIVLFVRIPNLFRQSKILIVTVGTAAWVADVRVIQFLHFKLRNLVKEKKAIFPNAQTKIRNHYQNFYSFWNTSIEGILFRTTRHFVAISNVVKEDLKELDEKFAERTVVIHHALDIKNSNFKVRPTNSGPTKILFVGALERKGIDKALEILRPLRHLNWRFDIVGDGDLEFWKSKAKKLKIEDKLHFHGHKSSYPFFENADIFLFPSLYEPFGLVITEAICHHLAVVASNECGSMELWQSRPKELNLSANDSAEKWTAAIERLIIDSTYRKNVSASAFSETSHWDWGKAALNYEKFFSEILSKNSNYTNEIRLNEKH